MDPAGASKASHRVFKNDTSMTCERTCAPMASFEWLADSSFWALPAGVEAPAPGMRITSIEATFLKKATTNSASLPVSQKHRVGPGSHCILISASKFDGYYLCIHHVAR